MSAPDRVVHMRAGEEGRYLQAYLDEAGDLHIDGEDVGPEIAIVTSRDSYEWFKTIAAQDIPRLCELVGGSEDDDILDLIERDWCGRRSSAFESLLQDSDIDVRLYGVTIASPDVGPNLRAGQAPREDLLSLADRIAADAHRGQTDKAGRPYIEHPRRVAARVAEHGGSVGQQTAALLHDVIEDTSISADDLRQLGISEEVVSMVVALTKLDGESHEQAVQRAAAHPQARLVKRCDIEDNTDPARLDRLDAATRQRLEAKYARATAILDRGAT